MQRFLSSVKLSLLIISYFQLNNKRPWPFHRLIKDHYTSAAVKDYFLNRMGQRIRMPQRFRPKQEYLTEHRKSCGF